MGLCNRLQTAVTVKSDNGTRHGPVGPTIQKCTKVRSLEGICWSDLFVCAPINWPDQRNLFHVMVHSCPVICMCVFALQTDR